MGLYLLILFRRKYRRGLILRIKFATKIPYRNKEFRFFKLAVTGVVGDEGSSPAAIRRRAPAKRTDPRTPQCASVRYRHAFLGVETIDEKCADLWRKENLACIWIFYRGPRWKTQDLDITGNRREGTGD